MCVAAAIAGASVVGGVVQGNAAQSAADTQAGAQEQAAAIQQQMFNTINGQEQPFMQAGYGATTALNKLLGLAPGDVGNLSNGYLTKTMGPFSFDPSSITSSPGYQFAQSQGAQQVLNADAPAVGALSGAALKDLTNFQTGTAEQYYNNYFNQAKSQYDTNLNSLTSQQTNIFSRLSNLANLGQNAASNTGQTGASLGAGTAQAIAASGASQAAGTVGASNAISGGLTNAGNLISLNNLLSQGGGGYVNPGFGAGNSPATATGSAAWGLGSAGS